MAPEPADVVQSKGGAMLEAKEDAYGGVIIAPDALPQDGEAFAAALGSSLAAWKDAGKKGVWLKLPIERSSLIPHAAAAGLTFHHAEERFVMMTTWLSEETSTIPPYASHQVGVGAFVINDKMEVLVVQEKNGPLRGMDVWKMPTGLVHCGEDLHTAAEREVEEETGVKVKFDAFLGIRQAHGFGFGKSDMFFVTALRAVPGASITTCPVEIHAAKWMPLEEYMEIQHFKGRPLYAKMVDRCAAWARGNYKGFTAAEMEAGLGGRSRIDLFVFGE